MHRRSLLPAQVGSRVAVRTCWRRTRRPGEEARRRAGAPPPQAPPLVLLRSLGPLARPSSLLRGRGPRHVCRGVVALVVRLGPLGRLGRARERGRRSAASRGINSQHGTGHEHGCEKRCHDSLHGSGYLLPVRTPRSPWPLRYERTDGLRESKRHAGEEVERGTRRDHPRARNRCGIRSHGEASSHGGAAGLRSG